jgi:hypothetical protein
MGSAENVYNWGECGKLNEQLLNICSAPYQAPVLGTLGSYSMVKEAGAKP